MKRRVLIPELMDDPSLDEGAHRAALQGLQRLNHWTGNARVAWQPILQLAQTLSTDKLTLFDMATGSGDVPIALHRLAKRAGIHLEIEAADLSDTALQVARTHFDKHSIAVSLHQLDAVRDRIPGRFDVVLCTTFLHHLTDESAVAAMKSMAQACRHKVVIVDLSRSRLNWLMVWFASRVLSRSPIVHFDGPQSVRAAFQPEELARLAVDAGLKQVETHTSWPCRFVLTGKPLR